MPISGPRPTAVLGPPLRSIELIVPSKPLSLSLRAPRGGVARHGVVLTDLQSFLIILLSIKHLSLSLSRGLTLTHVTLGIIDTPLYTYYTKVSGCLTTQSPGA